MRLSLPPLAVALGLFLSVGAPGAEAAPPQVVADIAPVAALAAAVLGAPVPALLGPGDDPHHFQLRPSQARALASADLVFWIGPGFTPWLAGVLAGAPGSAPLQAAEGVIPRPFLFGGEAHGAHGHGPDDGEPDGLGGSGAAPGAGTDPGPPDGTGGEDGTGHGAERDAGAGAADPHVWLDPGNAQAMLAAIAARLAALDPQNAARYAANAERAAAEVAAAAGRARAVLAPYRAAPLVVAHDAYAHWAAGFGLHIAASIADAAAGAPGAATLTALHRQLAALEGRGCVLAEPQHPARWAETLAGASGLRLGEVDPLAAEAPGDWFERMADSVRDCLQSAPATP